MPHMYQAKKTGLSKPVSDSYCWRTNVFLFEWTGEFFYIQPPPPPIHLAWLESVGQLNFRLEEIK